ncbi:transglycosylase SLT domain-containing protein [Pseudogemmobacter bohemicus]|uniref:transglycosylase SLT domain-containing protein n=1 Tax=Pseudogemmobacter bohemicus TaxID=2250708 RepID=UPI00130046CD|nr:transglycosylase SLT domain-containing protein [Pseudogemmobacter bohemicus]
MSRYNFATAFPLLVVCWPGFAPSAQGAGYAQQCLDAIHSAAQSSGVPREILLAVAMTESGRQGANGPEPWPWALNQAGDSMWFDSQYKALEWLDAAIARGVTNVDIGCFQLNWRWHGEAFASTAAMIDPQQNADYAAGFLSRLRDQTGSWDKAVAGYHSFKPELAERYMNRFRPIYASLQGQSNDAVPVSAEPERENNYPLLQMGNAQSAGSLVTVSGSARPLFDTP